MSDNTRQIERELEKAGIYAVVEEDRGQIVVTGVVDSEEEHQAALDVAADLAPGKEIVDNIEVEGVLPETVADIPMTLSEAEVGGFTGASPNTADDEAIEPGDFTDQPILENALNAAGPTGVAVDEDIAEGEEVYVPPIDPPSDGRDEVIGGFSTSAMDEIPVERSASDGQLGDEAIADAIRRELREDALTTALEIDVEVRDGVVRLRGRVATVDEAEDAEEVATRVPGVIEVRDELEIYE